MLAKGFSKAASEDDELVVVTNVLAIVDWPLDESEASLAVGS